MSLGRCPSEEAHVMSYSDYRHRMRKGVCVGRRGFEKGAWRTTAFHALGRRSVGYDRCAIHVSEAGRRRFGVVNVRAGRFRD